MSKEIVDKITNTEKVIDRLKQEVTEREQELLKQQEDSVEKYYQELDRTLDEYVSNQETELKKQHEIEIEQINNDIDSIQKNYERKYRAQQTEVIDKGIREVLNQHGDFSYETGSNPR